jgi:hypothetical protein
VAFFFCRVIQSHSGNAAFWTLETCSGEQKGVCWKTTLDRLYVTPENIVVHNKHNRGYSQEHCARAALICASQLQLCRITA